MNRDLYVNTKKCKNKNNNNDKNKNENNTMKWRTQTSMADIPERWIRNKGKIQPQISIIWVHTFGNGWSRGCFNPFQIQLTFHFFFIAVTRYWKWSSQFFFRNEEFNFQLFYSLISSRIFQKFSHSAVV